MEQPDTVSTVVRCRTVNDGATGAPVDPVSTIRVSRAVGNRAARARIDAVATVADRGAVTHGATTLSAEPRPAVVARAAVRDGESPPGRDTNRAVVASIHSFDTATTDRPGRPASQFHTLSSPSTHRTVQHDDIAKKVAVDADAGERAGDAGKVETHEVDRDPAGRDLDAVLAGLARDVAGEVVRAGLRDAEEGCAGTGGIGRVDRSSRLGSGCRLDRARRWHQWTGVRLAGKKRPRCEAANAREHGAAGVRLRVGRRLLKRMFVRAGVIDHGGLS